MTYTKTDEFLGCRRLASQCQPFPWRDWRQTSQ